MSGATIECAYLGGYQAAPASSQPIVGQLVLRESELRFEVMGEYSEVMFTVPWTDVTSWEADGSNAASSSSAMLARVLVGALVAGLPGAFIGSLAQRERYNTVLVVETPRDRIGFAIKDLPPVAVEAALRRLPPWPRSRTEHSRQQQPPRYRALPSGATS